MTKTKFDFEGKNVLITGAAGGIGRSLAQAFHAAGAALYLQYNQSEKNALELKSLLNERVTLIQADLTNEQQVDKLYARMPELHFAIANAGFYQSTGAPIHQMSLEQWQKTINYNLTLTFLTARGFFRKIETHKTREPSFVMIGSTAGHFGERNHADYAAAKSGIMSGLLLSLKNEITRLSPTGRVNVVAPGWTVTPMAEKFMEDKNAVYKTLQTLAMNKLAQPDDVARTTMFLCSELAHHITGEVIKVAGGMEGRVLWEQEEISYLGKSSI